MAPKHLLRVLVLGCLPVVSAVSITTFSSAHAAKAKKKKKVKAAPVSTQSKLETTLNEKRDAIQQCAVDNALMEGANRVDVLTRVTINGRGQVVDSSINVTIGGSGQGDRVKACVDKVLKTIVFPKSDAPLITIERTWTVAAQ